jgi:hypothetical protein
MTSKTQEMGDEGNIPRAHGGPQQPFTLFAAGGRIYVRNMNQKMIDLGALTREAAGFGYLLDGNQQSGSGFASEEAALRDLAGKLRYLWLDGQFTAVADARDDPAFDIAGATQFDFVLDELQPGERTYDATV